MFPSPEPGALPGTGVRLIRTLTPADVGHRVMLRRRLPDGGQGDVVGELVGWEAGVLRVRAGDGSLVEVADAALLAGKRVPPPPEERTSPERLQEVAAHGWRAVESDWLGRWWLRAADGFTGRANSVLPLGDPGTTLDAALEHVCAWYAARGLPPTAMVVVGSAVDAELARRGWQVTAPSFSHREVMAQTARLASVLARLEERTAAPAPVQHTVQLSAETDDRWLALYRGGGLPPVARHVLGHPQARFASVEVDGALAAIGRCVLVRRWAGLAAIEVAPDLRRRGLATAVVAALLRDAAARGARASYLFVTADNAAALPMYAALGFTTHHRYHYRRAPGG